MSSIQETSSLDSLSNEELDLLLEYTEISEEVQLKDKTKVKTEDAYRDIKPNHNDIQKEAKYLYESYLGSQSLKSFTSDKDFNKHKEIHTVEKSYKEDIEAFKENFDSFNVQTDSQTPYSDATIMPHDPKKIKHSMSEVNDESGAAADEPKDFACSFCGREFGVMRSLRRHENIHAGNLHKCNQCRKGFTDSWILRRHVIIHERIAKVKPQPIRFYCNHCHITFSSKRDLESHLCMSARRKSSISNNRKSGKANVISEAVNRKYIPSSLMQYPSSGSNIPGESIYGKKWVGPQVSGQAFTQLGFVCQFCGVSFTDNLDWKLHEEQEKIKISEAASSNLTKDDFIKNLVEGDQGQNTFMDEGNDVEALVKQGNVVRKSVIISVGRKKPLQQKHSSPVIADQFYSVLSPPSSLQSPSNEWITPSPSSFLNDSPTSDFSLLSPATAAEVFPSTNTELKAAPDFQSSLKYNTEFLNIKDQSFVTSSFYDVKKEYDVLAKGYVQIKEENFSN